MPNGVEEVVDEAVLRRDLEQLLEEQRDGDGRQDDGEEDERADEAEALRSQKT